ncbi:hypothetical protein [Oceaniglobus indicus]|uniref:hypothetical protein n=1 Tax=Oceaniglobus indicus TaxID=2047749 RepID=UPI000C187AF8|nr:hypothetical protein [Oceaniglobus indicus]
MTDQRNANAVSKSALSLFEVCNGYVLTQGRDALENIVLWERLMRFVAVMVGLCVAGLWLTTQAEHSREVLMMKSILSVVLLAICVRLFWRSRSRKQHEVRIDLIRRQLSQVMRGDDGSEQKLLCVGFSDIESLFIRRNRDAVVGSALFMRLAGVGEPVLLATGNDRALEAVHQRMTGDLTKARGMVDLPEPVSAPAPRPRLFQTA